MLFPANVPSYFSAIYAAGLFVGMRVFSLATGEPVQVNGLPGAINNVVPAAMVAGSETYLAAFTGTAETPYLFVFDVFTDGTYTVVDETKAEYSQSAFCKIMSPLLVQGLRIRVGCQNQPCQKPAIFSQSSSGNMLLSFFNEDGLPVDVSLATAWTLSVLEADGVTVLTKTPAPVAGAANQALAEFASADLLSLPPGLNDAQLGFTLGGAPYAFNLYGALAVQAPVA